MKASIGIALVILVVVAAAALLVFLVTPAAALEASAELRNADGQVVGTARFVQEDSGVRVTAQVKGISPGKHGIHIHAVGECEPAVFTSAGGHFNPEGKQHGLENPLGAHAGDLPNLDVAQDGAGSLNIVNSRVTLRSGATNSLFDADESALVVHASQDDQKTDPTGNSGGRILCGAIQKKG